MKILLYSHFFYPSIGGVETVSLTLAHGFVNRNVTCKVVTTTKECGINQFPFEIIRCPGTEQQIRLVKWADVILFNGASLALQPWIILFRKPFIWIHVGYQVSCIDGLGWVEGMRAPLKPFASIQHHIRNKGWKWGIKEGSKLLLKRAIAKYIVTKNVAITKWIEQIQPLPRQVQIYNPFPLSQFNKIKTVKEEFDFVYMGRIVSEKGIPTLLQAFSQVFENSANPLTLLIIGDGNWKQKMQTLAEALKIQKAVHFVGKKTGNELADWVAKGKIAIVPSEWYEPMGGAALELMASGKSLIVSEWGGLKECVGNAGLLFPNGDSHALSACMQQLLKDTELQKTLQENAKSRVAYFNPNIFIEQYIRLLKEVVGID